MFQDVVMRHGVKVWPKKWKPDAPQLRITRHRKAPNTASGTDTRMIQGSIQLSNCAASTRKMNTSASTSITFALEPDSRSSRDEPEKSYCAPGAASCSAPSSQSSAAAGV